MGEFLKAFFPNFASTILGLLIGLPLALWTNRLITARSEKAKQAEEQIRLKQALDTLSAALIFNRDRLANLADTFVDNKVAFDPALDYSTWDAVKRDVIKYLHEPSLQRQIAYHFSRMEALTKLYTLYSDNTVGITASLYEEPPLKKGLRGYLPSLINQLDKDAEQIVKKIDTTKKG